MKVEIKLPNTVMINNKEIYLNMSKDEVESIINTNYFEDKIKIEYINNKVKSIELENIDVFIDDINIFKENAYKIYNLLSHINNGNIINNNDYSYTFENLNLCIYRQYNREDIINCVLHKLNNDTISMKDINNHINKYTLFNKMKIGIKI